MLDLIDDGIAFIYGSNGPESLAWWRKWDLNQHHRIQQMQYTIESQAHNNSDDLMVLLTQHKTWQIQQQRIPAAELKSHRIRPRSRPNREEAAGEPEQA